MIENNKINKSFLVISSIYCLLAVIIISLVYFYSKSNLDREVLKLQNEISINSEIRSVNLRKWVSGKVESVNSISENISVKMYLSENQENSPLDEKLAQEQFIRNYLISEANKSGFTAKNGNSEIKANVQQNIDSTLVVFDRQGKQVVSIGLSENLRKIYNSVNEPIKLDSYFNLIFSENSTDAYFVILKSVKHIQSQENVGYVLGIKKLDNEFLTIADFPPEENKYARTDIALLVGNNLTILSSKLGDAYEKLANNKDGKAVAEIDAVQHPGNIIENFSRKSEKVLSLAKDFYDGKLFVIYSVNEAMSLKAARSSHRNILIVTILGLISIGLVMLLIWRHSSSIKYKKISSELRKQTNLLKLVTDNQLESMFLISQDSKILFANKSFFVENNSSAEEALDKPLANVLGSGMASVYTEISNRNLLDPITSTTEKNNESGEISYTQRKYIPVTKNYNDDDYITHLFVENDITPLMQERKKYENNLTNIIETIIRIIEQRSVYFYQHSQKLSDLSLSIADSLKVNDKIKRAVEISAKLCNLYIALLPRDVINKQEKLSDNERKMFDDFPNKTIEIIKDLEFDAPVIQTLMQLNEKPDGTGPQALKEEQIIDSAKILKVINDFIAMISDRPYRQKLSANEAIDILLRQKDKKYSSKVIYALANYIENHSE